MKQGAARLGTGTAPKETAAAKTAPSPGEDRPGSDSSGRLAALVGYVTDGTDRPALDRLRTAALHGAELIHGGAQRPAAITALSLAGQVAGLPQCVCEDALRDVLCGGAR